MISMLQMLEEEYDTLEDRRDDISEQIRILEEEREGLYEQLVEVGMCLLETANEERT